MRSHVYSSNMEVFLNDFDRVWNCSHARSAGLYSLCILCLLAGWIISLHSVAEAFALTKLPVCAVLIQRVSRSDDAVNCDCICAAVNMLPVMSALGCWRAAEKQQLHKTSPVRRMVRAVQRQHRHKITAWQHCWRANAMGLFSHWQLIVK